MLHSNNIRVEIKSHNYLQVVTSKSKHQNKKDINMINDMGKALHLFTYM